VSAEPPASERNDWLATVRDALAESAAVPSAGLVLDQHGVDLVLDIARIAAHASERTNAPLLCYLVGRLDRGTDLPALAKVVRRFE
jgi:Domain of unknown function (DUF6457)